MNLDDVRMTLAIHEDALIWKAVPPETSKYRTKSELVRVPNVPIAFQLEEPKREK